MSKPIKVVAFNGSSKPNGNTAQLIQIVFSELQKEGIVCEMITIGNCGPVQGCIGCKGCKGKEICVRVKDGDPANVWYAKMKEADGIILGSPTEFSTISVEMKSLIDRCGYINATNGGEKFKFKVGAAVVSVRRGGATHVFDCLNHFFLYGQMIVAGSSYWNEGIGRLPGEIQKDEEGKRTMHNLGKNMAYILKKLNHPDSADVKLSA